MSNAAAWVQAVGSILAVIAAFLVSYFQFRSALNLYQRQTREEQVRRYRALLALVDAALVDLGDILNGCRMEGTEKYFAENSAKELMEEYYQAFKQVSPLDMPSPNAVRAIVTLRDRLKAAQENALAAIDPDGDLAVGGKEECLATMENNLTEIRREKTILDSELASI